MAQSTTPAAPRVQRAPQSKSTRPRAELWRGISAALPLLIGVMPFGVVFGALAVTGGFTPLAAGAMSARVFAGSAQFLAVGLYSAQSPPAATFLATFILNLRHVLYGVALGKYYSRLTPRQLLPLAFTTTDEVFVLVQARVQQLTALTTRADAQAEDAEDDVTAYPAAYSDTNPLIRNLHRFALGSASLLYVGWQIATWIGILGGSVVPDPTRWGLDFALAASFIAFLVPQLRHRPTLIGAVVAGASALLLRNLPLQSGLILAILLGVAAALLAEIRSTPTPPPGNAQTGDPHD